MVALAIWLAWAGVADEPLMGFRPVAAREQYALEQRFDGHLRANNLRDWMRQLAARPHHVGSPYGKLNAHWIQAQFESWGYEARIEVFHVLFPTPRTRLLELIRPVQYKALLAEPALEEDATSAQQSEQLPTYNAFSVDGDVTGQLVYVNYGVPDDYEVLARHGIDVTGKIVIARYGGSWRGIKPKVAAEKGAIGCIIYSDPRDDGYYQGNTYPVGPFKSDHGVQRGSVLDMPLYPGDPLTPGVGATKDAERIPIEDALTLTRIPVLPISYGDALPLLRALGGPVAPEAWRGALPLTYHLGPGPAEVRLKLEFNWDIVPAYNVIALLRGSERPDQWIVRGNHHDAWVNGADDPISGLVAMMEEARAIGKLSETGWKPKRTLVYAAWDAEEPGLLGSTEWVETHADVLREKVVAYINSDSNGRGFLQAGGSHSLERFFGQVAGDVTDPQTGISVAERARARLLVHGDAKERKDAETRVGLRLAALGSGSDYTPFLQHLGVASLNIGFGGENSGGEYHSVYDSFDHYTRFGDPGFVYGIALAKTAGRAMLRLANADVLPFEFQHLAETVAGYRRELTELADTMRSETERHNRLISEGRFKAAADPRNAYVVPEVRGEVPYINFAPLNNAVTALARNAQAFDDAAVLTGNSGPTLTLTRRAELDRLLFTSERLLTRTRGLPGRRWFRHHLYAPGFYTGYGVKTLPAVREAIEQREWVLAEEQIRVTAGVLESLAGRILRAAEIHEGVAPAPLGAPVAPQ